MRDLGWVMLGGALGSGARYLVGVAVLARWGAAFPWATLGVNLVGSLALGLLWSLVEAGALPPVARVALGTGLLGGFTTYSTFSVEWARQLENGQWATAATYAAATVLGGIGCGLAGLWLGRALA